jgi:short subunit dehydrogenase-like uncharacterized protein
VQDAKAGGVRVREQHGVAWDRDMKQWTGPFIMAGVNTRVVARTGALLGYKPFTYSETQVFEGRVLGFILASLLSVALMSMALMMLFPPTRWLILWAIPPGSGPTESQRKNGFAKIFVIGKGVKDGQTITVRGSVTIAGDPGYQETSKMIGESALCLALDNLPSSGGCMTPASAMGVPLIKRLNANNLLFEVEGVKAEM